jgi:two-component system cell cycle response regulator DivK
MSRILIVEDNPDLLGILKELLSREYEVDTARTGEDAIRLADEHHPDAVILDLQLPSMDGMEAGRWIKTRLAPKHVPILVLTALAGPGDSEAILSSGFCDAYMAKPASLASIRAKIKELIPKENPDATI